MLADVLDDVPADLLTGRLTGPLTGRPTHAPHRSALAGRRRATLVALVTAVLTALALAGPVRPAAAEGPGTATILAQVNASRAAAGLAPLALASDLSSVAYAWSRHLASTGVLAHNPNLTGQVDDWQVVGENVGYGPTVTDVETAFMNSPRHRANILEPRYTQIGLGVVVDAGGTSWITQVFRKPMSTATAAATAPTTQTTRPATPRPTQQTTRQPATRTTSATAAATRTTAAGAPVTAATGRASTPARTAASPSADGSTPTATPSPSPSSSAADPAQLLAQRLAAAAAGRPAAADPIDAALGWAAAMDALAG